MSKSFVKERAEEYHATVKQKSSLDTSMVLIDGTVITIAKPKDNRATCYGHKRKYALKFQALFCPGGLALHAAGPMEGSRKYWTLSTSEWAR